MVTSIDEMNRFSIKDIENLTGIKAHTIRIWESRYGLIQPKRTTTNIRYYDARDLKVALKVALLNSYGYKISRINQMNDAEMDSLINKVADKDFKLQALVNNLLEATLSIDIELFETLLNSYIKKNGIEKTVEELIFLFLEKIGLMWMTDRIFPAQEHLVSNVILRKLAVAIEQIPPSETPKGKSVLLFLPEGEIHDLALLYVHYLLLKQNKNSIYLGPNTPLKDAKFLYEVKKPEYVYIHLTSVGDEFDGNKYLKKVATDFPTAQIFVSGSMLRYKKFYKSSNMTFLHTLEEVKRTLSEI